MTEAGSTEALREEILALRKKTTASDAQAASRAITRKFISLLPTGQFPALSALYYRALAGEPNLHDLAVALAARGVRANFPRIIDRKAKIFEAAEIEDLEKANWTTGAYGIEEPHTSHPTTPVTELNLIFTPGLLFGMNGERIGMGGGYYDRFVLQSPQALRVALCFDYQLRDSLPQSKWDQPVHWIVTEHREYRSRSADEWLKEMSAEMRK